MKKELLEAAGRMGFHSPTPIQEKCIPLITDGRDVVGQAETGSGKTVAFALPILDKVVQGKGIQVLVLTPTRELCVQVTDVFKDFGKPLGIKAVSVYGGVGMDPQISGMRTSEVVVGTPGRVLDHLGRKNMNTGNVSFLILDETDKMFEMGFIEDIRKILRYTQKGKQTLLFGATISREIKKLQQEQMNEPVTVQAEMQVGEDYLTQFYYDIKPHEKFSLLMHLLEKENVGQAIVFCSARKTVDIVAKNLRKQGISSESIHGNLGQGNRERALKKFNDGKAKILVASAVAARGLDIKAVSHVFNYDLSKDAQEYVHRVGRTARAGETGKAITLLSSRDHDVFREVLSRYDLKVTKLNEENFRKYPFDAGRRFGSRPNRPFGGQGRDYSGRRNYHRDSRRDNQAPKRRYGWG